MSSSVQSAVSPACRETAMCGIKVRPELVAAARIICGFRSLAMATIAFENVSQTKSRNAAFSTNRTWSAPRSMSSRNASSSDGSRREALIRAVTPSLSARFRPRARSSKDTFLSRPSPCSAMVHTSFISTPPPPDRPPQEDRAPRGKQRADRPPDPYSPHPKPSPRALPWSPSDRIFSTPWSASLSVPR